MCPDDPLGHLTSKIEQAGTSAAQTTSYGYDANGEPTTTTTPDGKTTTNTYDGLGRVIAIQNPDDTTTQATFDAASHTLTSSGSSGTTTYAYDPLGRISSETQKNASGALISTTSYAYDPNGNLLTPITTDGSGHQNGVTYTYDKLGRISSISDGTHTYTYDANGNPSSMQVLNNGSAVYEADFAYDGGNRQTTLTDRVGPNLTQLDQYITTYDQKNNPTEVDTNGTATHYKYNAASELVEVDDGTNTAIAKYTYDANHNRLSQWTTTGTTSYQYDSSLTKLTQQTDSAGKVTQYTYDTNGNLTKAVYDPIGANQTTTYSYDANQRLSEMDKPDGSKIVFTYDSNGNRIAKTVTTGGASPTTTQIKDIYQGGRIAYETDGVNTILATFAYDASGQPTSVQVGSDPSTAPRYYYVYNTHGDVVALVDSSGNSVAVYDYDAFGAVQFDTDNFSNGWHNPYLYDGKDRVRYDTETGLYWMSVRAYDPALGRFISRDPLGRAPLMGLSTQPYVYGDNNPLKNVDPSGQMAIGGGGATFLPTSGSTAMHNTGPANPCSPLNPQYADNYGVCYQAWEWSDTWPTTSAASTRDSYLGKELAKANLFLLGGEILNIITDAALIYVEKTADGKLNAGLDILLSVLGLGDRIVQIFTQRGNSFAEAAFNWAMGTAQAVVGIIKAAIGAARKFGWLGSVAESAAVDATTDAVGGFPGLLMQVASWLAGPVLSQWLQAGGHELIALGNVLLSDYDYQESVDPGVWCIYMHPGKCSAPPPSPQS